MCIKFAYTAKSESGRGSKIFIVSGSAVMNIRSRLLRLVTTHLWPIVRLPHQLERFYRMLRRTRRVDCNPGWFIDKAVLFKPFPYGLPRILHRVANSRSALLLPAYFIRDCTLKKFLFIVCKNCSMYAISLRGIHAIKSGIWSSHEVESRDFFFHRHGANICFDGYPVLLALLD